MSRRARGGCGCTGCLGQLVLFVLLGVVIVSIVRALFAPWAFFLGGRFHPLAAWAGEGTLHARSGDFVLFVELEPRSRTSSRPRTRVP